MEAPCQEKVIAPANRIWRDGEGLVLSKKAPARLPARCVKCNAPAADGEVTRQVYWIPSKYHKTNQLLDFLILFFPVNGLVGVAIVRTLTEYKVTPVVYCVCRTHQARRRRAIWIMAALCVGFVCAESLLIALIQSNHPIYAQYPMPVKILAVLMPVCALLSLLYGAVATRRIFPLGTQDRDDDIMKLGGFGSEFIEGFPDYQNELADWNNNPVAN